MAILLGSIGEKPEAKFKMNEWVYPKHKPDTLVNIIRVTYSDDPYFPGWYYKYMYNGPRGLRSSEYIAEKDLIKSEISPNKEIEKKEVKVVKKIKAKNKEKTKIINVKAYNVPAHKRTIKLK